MSMGLNMIIKHNFLIFCHYWLPGKRRPIKKRVASMSKKDKMANGSPRKYCVSHSPSSWADFLRGGDGPFQIKYLANRL